MDSLEVSMELLGAVKRLLSEASSVSGHRRELLPGLSVDDVAFELLEPREIGAVRAPLLERPGVMGRFRVREERWRQEMMSESVKLAKQQIKKLSAAWR